MARALSNYGVDSLETDSGDAVLWRQDLGKRLLNLQHAEGYWVNTNGRWMEKDPVLVTAYCLLALEFAAQGL
jgi:squalene-hopene/tetraprenyl-beta-curcumene cyclase